MLLVRKIAKEIPAFNGGELYVKIIKNWYQEKLTQPIQVANQALKTRAAKVQNLARELREIERTFGRLAGYFYNEKFAFTVYFYKKAYNFKLLDDFLTQYNDLKDNILTKEKHET